jgi:hypothetical protein
MSYVGIPLEELRKIRKPSFRVSVSAENNVTAYILTKHNRPSNIRR